MSDHTFFDQAGNWISSTVSGVYNSISGQDWFSTPEQASGTGLAQSTYNFRYTVFPNDVGMDYVGHYMVININVPTVGFRRADLSQGLQVNAPAGNYTNQFTPLNQVSKVDSLRFGTAVGEGNSAAWVIPRQTRRIAESIALFMPQGLYFSQENLYEDISLTETAGKIGVGAASVAGLGGLASTVGSLAASGAQLMSNPINPSVEVMFTTTYLRQYDFIWLFAPRNVEESTNLRTIIRALKFHGSPEINTALTGLRGTTWIPPAEFDITIFNKGAENINILRINTCVLRAIEIDYHPEHGQFSTFRNGHPVQVRIRLQFQEVEPIHKLRVLQGF